LKSVPGLLKKSLKIQALGSKNVYKYSRRRIPSPSACEDAFKSRRCLQVLLPDCGPAGLPGRRSGEALSHFCGKYSK
jgi:hypothetical protein